MYNLLIDESSTKIEGDSVKLSINVKVTDTYQIQKLIEYYNKITDIIDGLPF